MSLILRTIGDFASIFLTKPYLIISYPKSGNTLIRFILLNAILIKRSEQPVLDHETLNKLMPEIRQRGQRSRDFFKFYKSHHIVPFRNTKLILIIRNPFDTLCSLYEYYNSRTALKFENINLFLNSKYGLSKYADFLHFVRLRILNHKNHIIRYEDILENKTKVVEELLMFVFKENNISIVNQVDGLTERSNLEKSEVSSDNPLLKGFSSQKDYLKYKSQINSANMNIVSKLQLKYDQTFL